MNWTAEEWERYQRKQGAIVAEEQANQDYEKESELQAECEAFLKEKGHWFLHLADNKGVKGNKIGIPDLLICVNSMFVAVELKIKRRKPSLEQVSTLQSIRRAGGRSEVIYSFLAFRKLIAEVEK